MSAIIDNAEDQSQPSLQKDALLTLVNISSESSLAWKLLNLTSRPKFVFNLLKYTLAEESVHAEIASSLLNNLSRPEKCAKVIVEVIRDHDSEVGFHRIVAVFGKDTHNKYSKLHTLAMFLANLTQLPDTRNFLLDRERCVIQRILPFTMYPDSRTRRGAVASILRNCCFDTGWFFSIF